MDGVRDMDRGWGIWMGGGGYGWRWGYGWRVGGGGYGWRWGYGYGWRGGRYGWGGGYGWRWGIWMAVGDMDVGDMHRVEDVDGVVVGEYGGRRTFRNGEVLYPLPNMIEEKFYKEGLCFFKSISKSAF